MKIAYIFLNGELKGSVTFYKDLLNAQKGDIFCADGGAKHLDILGIMPMELWGDLDSVSQETIDRYEQNNVIIKRFPAEKDKTDGELIVDHVSHLDYDKIYIIGGLGGRTDHMLSNLLWIFMYDNIFFISEREIIFKAGPNMKIEGFKDRTVSFVPYSERIKSLTLIGFKYPLDKYDLIRGDSRCMSNIIIQDICSISFLHGELMCIIDQK